MSRKAIPALLRELRQRLSLTQEQFAQRIGVTYSTVNHWENGKRAPQPFLLRRLRELESESGADAGPAAIEPAPAADPPPRRPSGTGPFEPLAGAGEAQDPARQMVQRIVERFRPEQVILFGSRARGEAHPDSDVDLLVVMRVAGSKRDVQLRIRRALHDIPVPKDVIVTTPEEFAWRREVAGTIERLASTEGRVLHAAR